jgi:putative acetyltransferase
LERTVTIRRETPDDATPIYVVNSVAFGRRLEADIVDKLRESGNLLLSFVAETDGIVVGAVAFSPARITLPSRTFEALACGPVAVLPEFQRQGIGIYMLQQAMSACADLGHELIFLLGHPTYYPRVGFKPVTPLGVRWENNSFDDGICEPFMVKELREGALARGIGTERGVMAFGPEFGGH